MQNCRYRPSFLLALLCFLGIAGVDAEKEEAGKEEEGEDEEKEGDFVVAFPPFFSPSLPFCLPASILLSLAPL